MKDRLGWKSCRQECDTVVDEIEVGKERTLEG
jgi:hypothetical protein